MHFLTASPSTVPALPHVLHLHYRLQCYCCMCVHAHTHARTQRSLPERQKTQIKRQIPEGIICILLLLAQGCTLELPYSKDKNQSMMCVTTQCIGKQTHTHQLAQSTDVQYSPIKQTGRRTYKSNKGYRQIRITEGIRTKE